MNLPVELNQKMLFRFFKKYLLVISLFGVLCGVLGSFSVFKLQPTEYESTGMLVQNDNNYNLVQSYQQFIGSQRFKKIIANKVDNSAWKNKSYKSDYNLTFVSVGTTSPFFKLTISSGNSDYSKYLASLVTQLFMADIGKYLSGANVSIVTEASKSVMKDKKSSSIKVGLISFIIGLVLASCVLFNRFIFSGQVSDPEYIQDVYNLKLLGDLDLRKSTK